MTIIIIKPGMIRTGLFDISVSLIEDINSLLYSREGVSIQCQPTKDKY